MVVSRDNIAQPFLRTFVTAIDIWVVFFHQILIGFFDVTVKSLSVVLLKWPAGFICALT